MVTYLRITIGLLVLLAISSATIAPAMAGGTWDEGPEEEITFVYGR